MLIVVERYSVRLVYFVCGERGKILFCLSFFYFYIHHAYLVNVLVNGARSGFGGVTSHGRFSRRGIIFWKYGTYGFFLRHRDIYERVIARARRYPRALLAPEYNAPRAFAHLLHAEVIRPRLKYRVRLYGGVKITVGPSNCT